MKVRVMSKKQQHAFQETDGRCSYCGIRLELEDHDADNFCEFDHYPVPKSLGGAETVPSCRRCNRFRRAEPADFVRQLIAYDRGQFETIKSESAEGAKYEIQRALVEQVRFYFEKKRI